MNTKKNIFVKKLNSTESTELGNSGDSVNFDDPVNSDKSTDSVDSTNLSDEFKDVILGKKNNKVGKTNKLDKPNNTNKPNNSMSKISSKNYKNLNLSSNFTNEIESGINGQKESESTFDISNVYFDIQNCFKKYTNIKIIGEIISFKISDSNAWVTIKSKEFQISGIFWSISNSNDFNNLKLTKPGDQISFFGCFSMMKKNLSVYFNIKSMEKIGKGKYLDIYEQYRLRIKELGLGIPKKKLSGYPAVIGIITASEGAAIQDILQTFKLDRFVGKIIIKNSIVQGSQCPKSLVNSIEWFEINYHNNIDILMVTRGGGGWEDLVGFSDWELLEKISSTPFVTLSAVGHQVDNQLTDEVCDYKFATPSIGAKFIVETQQKYRSNLLYKKNLLTNLLDTYSKQISRYNFITNNYPDILFKYDIKKMSVSVRRYKNLLDNTYNKFSKLKGNFYSILSQLKPTIIRKKELTSINDFVSKDTNKEVSPKKIEIYFIDGRIGISYKITEYKHY